MSLNFLCTAATSLEGSTYNCVRCGPLVSPSSPPHPAPPSPHGKLFATVNCPGVAQATADSMPSMFEPVIVSNMKGWSYRERGRFKQIWRMIKLTCQNSHEPQLAPILPPRISNDPVFIAFLIHTPTDDRNNMIHKHILQTTGFDHASLVVHERVSIYTSLNIQREAAETIQLGFRSSHSAENAQNICLDMNEGHFLTETGPRE